MVEKDKELLAELNTRIKQLMYLCDSLKEENISLRKRLQEKNTEVEYLGVEIEQLKIQYDNLRVAKSLVGGNHEEITAAKVRLARLVQDVEKCIVLLKG